MSSTGRVRSVHGDGLFHYESHALVEFLNEYFFKFLILSGLDVPRKFTASPTCTYIFAFFLCYDVNELEF